MDKIDWRKKLKTAVPTDFHINNLDLENDEIKYVVSYLNCIDLGWFIRKSDAERFIETFKGDK